MFNIFAYSDNHEDESGLSRCSNDDDINDRFYSVYRECAKENLSKSSPHFYNYSPDFTDHSNNLEYKRKSKPPPIPPRRGKSSSFKPEFFEDVHYLEFSDLKKYENSIENQNQTAFIITPYNNSFSDTSSYISTKPSLCENVNIDEWPLKTAFTIGPYQSKNSDSQLPVLIRDPEMRVPFKRMSGLESKSIRHIVQKGTRHSMENENLSRTPAQYRKPVPIINSSANSNMFNKSNTEIKTSFLVSPYHRNHASNNNFESLVSSSDSLNSIKTLSRPIFDNSISNRLLSRSESDLIEKNDKLTWNDSACSKLISTASFGNFLHDNLILSRSYKQPTYI